MTSEASFSHRASLMADRDRSATPGFRASAFCTAMPCDNQYRESVVATLSVTGTFASRSDTFGSRDVLAFMLEHSYPFDPTHGFNLGRLLSIRPPDPPEDLASFWRTLLADALSTKPAPALYEQPNAPPEILIFDVEFTSLGDFRVGGWLTRPRHGPIERGVIVGHGYGGREGPDLALQRLAPFRRAAMLFPCARGISRSARSDLPSQPDAHVLHGIADRGTYIHGPCAADLVFCAANAMLALPWDDRYAAAHVNVPSFGHHPLRLTLPCVGSGESVRRYHRSRGAATTLDVLRYFDAATNARLLKIPIHVAPACFDPAVPPPGQFAIYNALPKTRQLFLLEAGHFEHPGLMAESERLLQDLALFFEPANDSTGGPSSPGLT